MTYDEKGAQYSLFQIFNVSTESRTMSEFPLHAIDSSFYRIVFLCFVDFSYCLRRIEFFNMFIFHHRKTQ